MEQAAARVRAVLAELRDKNAAVADELRRHPDALGACTMRALDLRRAA